MSITVQSSKRATRVEPLSKELLSPRPYRTASSLHHSFRAYRCCSMFSIMSCLSLLTLLLASFVQRVVSDPQGLSLPHRLPVCAVQETHVPPGALIPVAGSGQFLATAAPDLTAPASAASAAASASACGGCYIVADVAGIVFYSEVFQQTVATAVVSVGVANGSRSTSTSVVQAYPQITINPAAPDGGPAIEAVSYASEVSLNGAVLTSPTPYNVFTAYSVTSAVLSGGICSTVSGPRVTLSSAYSQALSSASGHVVLDQGGEQSFINQLGFSSCSGGGINLVPSALVPVSPTTATSTQTFFSGSPIGALAPTSVSSFVCSFSRFPCTHMYRLIDSTRCLSP